jgi:hypothetical protein
MQMKLHWRVHWKGGGFSSVLLSALQPSAYR